MRLFIAEKPSLARAIADNLKGSPVKRDGYIECGSDVVTWCFGHMLELAQPEDYNPAWKTWSRSCLPIIPDKFRLVERSDAKQQLRVIKKLLADASEVVNAGDPDREGQLLVDEVLEHFDSKKPCKRVWLASLDPKSVQKALASLKDNGEYRGFQEAASTRRNLDWLAGINLTRAMTIFGREAGISTVLSLGRVQTPTLALIVGRDLEIENFRPVDYAALKIFASHENGGFWASYNVPKEGEGVKDGYFVDFDAARKIMEDCGGRPGKIVKAVQKSGKEAPPLPYSLSTLQKDASASLGLSAQATLDLAQELYEGQLTTYPRSDCQYLPLEQFDGAKDVLASLGRAAGLAGIAAGANPKLKSAAWNTGKITAHHAIIPTGQDAGGLKGNALKLYELIAVRYMIQFYPALEYKSAVIDVKLDNDSLWTARGRVVTNPGWKACVKESGKQEEAELPKVSEGDAVKAEKCEMEKKQTKPPSRFTEGAIIEAMSGVHLFVDDKEAKARLKETSGLGTEATRAGIIETLKKRAYIENKGKSLVSTKLGREVIALCPPMIRDIVTTAVLEDELAAVQAGKKGMEAVLGPYRESVGPMIDSIFAGKVKSAGNVPKCPKCGKALLRRKGKAGFFWGCSGYPDCSFLASDEKGRPGGEIVKGPKVDPPVKGEFKCPLCGNVLSYGVSAKTGRPYWACFNKSPKHDRKAKFWNPKEDGSPNLD